VVAFNRPEALSRLLGAIGRGVYASRPTVFISLDGGASEAVVDVAVAFRHPDLDVQVIRNTTHLGLRRHVLQCGDLSIDHGAVIVLEDDLYVDPYFHQYACAASSYFASDPAVAGISLYGQEYNEYARLPFHPMRNGTSCYPMQVPCSWGQCWTREQWSSFKDWYQTADAGTVETTIGLPEAVKRWPESSWKKYFAAYLVRTGKYFVYPYESYTTNCSDAGGTHIVSGSRLLHASLSLPGRPRPSFAFSGASDAPISYDAYMEPSGTLVDSCLGLGPGQVAVNHYATKPIAELKAKPLVLSRERYGEPLHSYPIAFRPIEANLFHPAHSHSSDTLHLCRTTGIGRSSRDAGHTMSSFGYYARMPLLTRRLVRQLARELPLAAWKALSRRSRS
jgi:hypothetical protein